MQALSSSERSEVLRAVAAAIGTHEADIIAANALDMQEAKRVNVSLIVTINLH